MQLDALSLFVRIQSDMRALLVLLFSLAAFAAEPLNNAQVVQMVQGKVPIDVIIQKIADCEPHFSMQPGDLIQLAAAGVPDDVIRAIAAKTNGVPIPGLSSTPRATTAAPAPVSPTPPTRRIETPRDDVVRVFGGYSYLNVDTNDLSSRQSMNGWESSVSFNANKWVAGEVGIAGYYRNNVLGSGIDARNYSFLAGPRFNAGPAFFHTLFGLDHLIGSVFGLSASQNSFAIAIGGGLDAKLSGHWGVRSSVDFVITHHNLFGGPGVAQNNFRFGGGIVYRFGRGSF